MTHHYHKQCVLNTLTDSFVFLVIRCLSAVVSKCCSCMSVHETPLLYNQERRFCLQQHSVSKMSDSNIIINKTGTD